jgi:bidirectional [NiFe] hydrogenase diaphorase subunit
MDLTDLLEIADKENRARPPVQIRCCTAAGCASAGSQTVLERLQQAVSDAGLEDRIGVSGVGCLRLCARGPLVAVDPEDALFQQVTPENASSIVAGVQGGQVTARRIDASDPFFALQSSVVLENSGKIDPERIEAYIAAGGYQSLGKVVRDMTPEQVIETITHSGLRGRGGAGYPAGVKWATVAKNAGQDKYVVCNADEGDPGAFMNRSVMESDPHRLLEGMAIAGYAVGAKQGYIYVRGEYPLAIERLEKAIKQAGRLGLLGTRVFSTPFGFRIDLRIGAGAFVCGEETSLMASIMGTRGGPTPRPPYPAESGLWGMPTLINNVETFANVPVIIREGPQWYAALGAPGNAGTKVFCLTGKVVNTGLVEVPLGTSLRTIVEDIGGGAPDGPIKAVQTGGPSGGCIPAELLDTPVDYESLAKVGSIMGSGGMIVMDASTNMVDVARYFMEFCKEESCGKCIPCRVGTVQMHRLLLRILDGTAGPEELQRLEMLCDMVRKTSLCGLGQTAPNPTLSTLRYFRHEYEERLRSSPVPQGPGRPDLIPMPINGQDRSAGERAEVGKPR